MKCPECGNSFFEERHKTPDGILCPFCNTVIQIEHIELTKQEKLGHPCPECGCERIFSMNKLFSKETRKGMDWFGCTGCKKVWETKSVTCMVDDVENVIYSYKCVAEMKAEKEMTEEDKERIIKE